jgi:tetratricopeptide (TPR) repeat protein
MDYSAVGETTHLAARMEQMAKAGTILIAANTLRLAEGYIQVKALGPVPVKGLTRPMDIYEMTGATGVRSRFQAAAARGLTRFVGRDSEIAQLGRVLERARSGQGQAVAVVGEPGVGKSRLVYEFTHSSRTEGWLILEGGSVSYGKATPYQPIIDLLKTYFKIGDRDDHREMREKIIGKLLALDRALAPDVPAFLALLDVPVEDRQWEALDPPQRRQRTLGAIVRLLLRESQEQPVLAVFEDLQWVDAESQELLDSLVESLPAARLLLFVNYRPEYAQRWGHKSYYAQFRIDRLLPESAEELLRALLGDDPALRALKQLLVERTDGNPFFLEESVRTLVETEALSGDRGAYRLTRPIHTIQVPATVHAVLAARIDRLPAQEKGILQSASVIGKDVPLVLLQAITDLSEPDRHRGLAHLQAAEFLYETRLFPDEEYTFKHALTHEVAYASLLHSRRRALHGDIVDTIERLYADRLAEQVERLAYHAIRGERWDKALGYLRQAGARAAARSAHREAVSYFEQALEVLKRLPESRQTREQAVDIRIDLRNSLFPLGEHAAIREHVQAAEVIARALDDPRRLGWVSALLAHYSWRMGAQAQAVEYGERALALSLDVHDLALQVSAQYYLGLAFHALGLYERSTQFLGRSIELLTGDLLHERFGMTGLPSVFCRTWFAWGAAETGQFGPAIARATEGLHIAEAADHPYSLVFACRGLSHVHLGQGYPEKAIPLLERGLGLCQTWGFPTLLAGTAPSLGFAYVASGRVKDGLALLEPAVALATARDLRFSLSLWAVHLAQAYLVSGRPDDAHRTALRGLELARDCQERANEAWALRLLAEIAAAGGSAAGGDPEEAYQEALALAQTLGMRPLVARCHLGLGAVLRRRGRRAEAREQLEKAADMFRSMEMSRYLARTEEELNER